MQILGMDDELPKEPTFRAWQVWGIGEDSAIS